MHPNSGSSSQISEPIPGSLQVILDEIRRLYENGHTSWSPWMTKAKASSYCGLSEKTLSRWISQGRLKSYRPAAGCILVKREELDAVIRSAAGKRSTRGRKKVATDG
jgi:excisionase family DNA binding protein